MNGLKDNQGQAVFEFIIFLPLLIFLAVIINIMGYSINTSINQQKVTRGYFYYITAHNSFAPDRFFLKDLNNINSYSLDSIGWREEEQGESSIAECFALPTLFSGRDEAPDCHKPDIQDGRAKMIRIYTAYGICSATYRKNSNTDEFMWMQSFEDSFIGGPFQGNPELRCQKS